MDTSKATDCSIISFINLKGGVGKTSTTINFANVLSLKGSKVLVIDMDPQFNATQALLSHQYKSSNNFITGPSKEHIESKIKLIFDEQGLEEQGLDIDDFKDQVSSQLLYDYIKSNNGTINNLFAPTSVVHPHANPSLEYQIKDNLFLIPGDLDLFESLPGDSVGKHEILERHIVSHDLRNNYDYILIDCPPNWTILTQSSLFASDYYIVPSKIDLFSSVGISLLEKLVNKTFLNESPIRSHYTLTRKSLGFEELHSLGVIFTLTDKIKIAETIKQSLTSDAEIKSTYFDNDIPNHPSISLKYPLYTDAGQRHETLKNAVEKAVLEMTGLIKGHKVISEGSTSHDGR